MLRKQLFPLLVLVVAILLMFGTSVAETPTVIFDVEEPIGQQSVLPVVMNHVLASVTQNRVEVSALIGIDETMILVATQVEEEKTPAAATSVETKYVNSAEQVTADHQREDERLASAQVVVFRCWRNSSISNKFHAIDDELNADFSSMSSKFTLRTNV